MRAHDYNFQWEYNDNGTIFVIKKNQAQKLQYIFVYSKSKVEDSTNDAENPSAWTELAFDTW